MTPPAVEAEAAIASLEAERVRSVPVRVHWGLARFLTDVAMVAMGVALAETGWRAAGFEGTPVLWTLAFPVLCLGLLYVRGAYTPRVGAHLVHELRKVVGAATVAWMAATTGRVIAGDEVLPSAQVLRPWLFATACLVAGRCALSWAEARSRRRGEMLRPTLILGAGRVGQLLARRLRERPELGLEPVGFLDKEPLGEVEGLPVLGASWDLDRIVEERGVEHVVVTFSTAPHDVLLRVVKRCEELGLEVSLVPRLFERLPERVTVDHVGGIPLVTPHAVNPRGWQFALKYAFDRLGAAMLLILLLPVLTAAALAVFVSMGRPVFFRQARIGLDGREFGMLKLRTMRGKPEDGGEADADWAASELGLAGDAGSAEDRRTPLGRILRTCSVDELPQLWNVLRGDMSLVGPRPERAHYARRFEEAIYRYAERHRVKSGITGWAQVNGLRGRTSLAERVEWDNYYIENWSLWLDLVILLKTPFALSSLRDER
jgi:exopolysaccharide biosynthesis polyprenyl glycosylphosphotransferase